MTEKGLTKREKRWAFQYAKRHMLEALDDVMTDEAHSIINECGKPRLDIRAEVMRLLENYRREIKARRFSDEAESVKRALSRSSHKCPKT